MTSRVCHRVSTILGKMLLIFHISSHNLSHKSLLFPHNHSLSRQKSPIKTNKTTMRITKSSEWICLLHPGMSASTGGYYSCLTQEPYIWSTQCHNHSSIWSGFCGIWMCHLSHNPYILALKSHISRKLNVSYLNLRWRINTEKAWRSEKRITRGRLLFILILLWKERNGQDITSLNSGFDFGVALENLLPVSGLR